jgi:hypothetical protein
MLGEFCDCSELRVLADKYLRNSCSEGLIKYCDMKKEASSEQ